TAFSDAVVMEDIRGAEPYGYVLKPYDPRQLHAVLQVALGRRAREMGEAAANREQMRVEALLGALETACVEHWEWVAKDGARSWPEDVQVSTDRLLPVSDDDPRRFLRRIVPADRERVRAAFTAALQERSRIDIGYRRLTTEGVLDFAVSSGVTVRDDNGRARMSGVEIGIPSHVYRQADSGGETASGEQPGEWTTVSLDAVVNEAAARVKTKLADADITHSALPAAPGNAAELATLFEILLSTIGAAGGRIEISGALRDDACIIDIQGGGVPDDVSLATCKPILARHGGVLQLQPSEGA